MDETNETTQGTATGAAELTFSAGQRAVLDLRDSSGTVALKDWDEPVIKIASEASPPPFVLQDGETFRIRMAGGTITLPSGLPAEVLLPPAVQLRSMRVTRAGGETVVRPVATGQPGGAEAGAAPQTPPGPPDLAEFARLMSEHGRRIFAEMTRAIRASEAGISEEVARRLDEAAERIDEQARRVAERVQREVERSYHAVERAQEHARRAAERLERHAGRWEEGGRKADRAARPGRGRWWFTERLEQWGAPGAPAAGARVRRPPAEQERRLILQMLQEGKITSEQAARLLDALG